MVYKDCYLFFGAYKSCAELVFCFPGLDARDDSQPHDKDSVISHNSSFSDSETSVQELIPILWDVMDKVQL